MADKEAKSSKAHLNMPARVLACKCEHEFQDGRYGKGQRLHNPCQGPKFRCTVCGEVKQ